MATYIHVESAIMPTKATPFVARVDVYSTKEYEVSPYDKMLIDMRIVMQISVGYYGQITLHLGQVYHHFLDIGARVVNPDYTGSLKVLIYNFDKQPYIVKPGNKIVQVIFEKIAQPILAEVNQVTEQARGDKSSGSMGK